MEVAENGEVFGRRPKRKFLFSIISSPFRSQTVFRKEAKTLKEAGWHVRVIAWDRKNQYPKKDTVDDIPIDNISVRASYETKGIYIVFKTIGFWLIALYKLFIYRHQVDVFHCQDLNTLVPGLVASRLLNKPVVFDAKDPYPEMISIVHSAAFVKFTNFVERFLCRHVDTIRTVNQLMRQRFEKITSKPIHIVHNYPELKDFNPEKYQGKEADQTLVFGRIGQIREGMGIEETVEAIKHILKKVRVQLLFVGRIKDSYRYRFMELIDPIRNNVEYVNEVPYSNIPDYYYRMDVFMLLYNMKGIASYISPTKLFDSMAMGVPVIASDVGETRDFVEKYKCGLVIKSNEKELILNAMETMIFNPDLRITFGQNGLRAAKTTTNWEKEKIKFVKVFNDCIRAS